MADYTDNTLRSSIKALEQVVQPAVDPEDPLAGEQLRLVLGFLKFLRLRLRHWHARHTFELNHYLALARGIAADARHLERNVYAHLQRVSERAQAVQRDPFAAVNDIESATAALATAVSAVARVVGSAEIPLRERIERRLLEESRRWVDMQRAWFLPQGFELHPESIPDLEQLLSSDDPRRHGGGSQPCAGRQD